MLKTNLQYLEEVVDHRGNSCLALLRVAQPCRGLLVNLVSEQTTSVFVRLRHASAALATDFLIAFRDHVDDLSNNFGEALELRRVRDEIIECI